jgi:hypothetical protein
MENAQCITCARHLDDVGVSPHEEKADGDPEIPAVSVEELRDRVRMWVIRRKTSDGCGLYDSWFMIHAQQAIDWIVEYVSEQARRRRL